MNGRTAVLACALLLVTLAGGEGSAALAATLVIEAIPAESCATTSSEKPADRADGVLSVEQIMLAGDRELPLEEIELPAGWLLDRRGSGSALRQVAPCAEPLEIPVTGDWVRLRLAGLARDARIRFGGGSRWIERRPPDSSPVSVELGARVPGHRWRTPHWVPFQQSLSGMPAVLESTAPRPRRISFDEQRSLDPSPVLPAKTLSLPATIELTDLFLPREATLRLGLDAERESRVSVEVEALTPGGTRRAARSIDLRPNPLEPTSMEIPLENVEPSRGDLRLQIRADGPMPVRLVDPKLVGLQAMGPAGSEKPNVILITLDTVRADHLSLYGYPRPTTPFLDSLSHELLVFDNAYSQVPSTRPSHYSIFTSRYPHDLGIWSNEGAALPRSELTLSEVLGSAGWRTGAALSVDFLMLQSGLDQGFDWIDRPEQKGERLGEVTTEAALDFIAQSAGSPFFLWIHYFDAHLPYQPLPRYRGLFWEGPPPEEADIAPELIEKEGFGTVHALPHRAYMTAMYDASLRYLDDQMRALFGFLAAADLLDDTIVVIAADHGESLGENGVYFGHEGLYEPTVRVPLALRVPEGSRTGRIGAIVENLDIAATVLDLVGLETPPSFRGSSLLADEPGDGQAILEHTGQYFIGIRRGPWKWIDATNFESQERFARTNLRELHAGPSISLFDLDADPMEKTNLAESRSRESEELRSTLERWAREGGQDEPLRGPAIQPVDPKLRESLRALGYAE